MNKAFLIGRVGQNPELKTFDGGGKVANFTLATSKSWKDKQTGEKKEKTTWHNVQASGVKADVVMGLITKGSKIAIEGEIDNSSYEKNGEKRIFSRVNMLNFEFCDSKKKEEGAPQETSNEEIPF